MSTTAPNYLRSYEQIHAINPRQAAGAWFRDAKYGLFLHYGLYSILGRMEWVQLREAIRPGTYAQLAHCFTASRFDAAALVDFAVECGMRYINLTTRHHDSFCLWRTRQTTFNSVDAAPARRDLVAELAEACDRRGVGLCLYYSHGRDWKHPHAPNNDRFGGSARPAYDPPEPTYAIDAAHELDQYVEFMKAQITELLTGYGPIAAIWLDGIGVPLHPKDERGEIRTDYDPRHEHDPFRCQELYDHIHALQPQTLIAYKQGYLGTEDFFAPEHSAYNRFNQSFDTALGEVCTQMTPDGWGYIAGEDVQRRSVDEVCQMLADARANHCNLLLNAGPRPDGSLDPRDERVLRAVGDRIKRGEIAGL